MSNQPQPWDRTAIVRSLNALEKPTGFYREADNSPKNITIASWMKNYLDSRSTNKAIRIVKNG